MEWIKVRTMANSVISIRNLSIAGWLRDRGQVQEYIGLVD